MNTPIYLDHHATTPLDPRVLEAMLPYFTKHFGNASSPDHIFGWEAKEALDLARVHVAQLIHARDESEIIFTSGATESSNLAWLGNIAEENKKYHFITSAIEHSASLETAKFLQRNGHEISILPVDHLGRINLQALESAIRPNTKLVSIQAANNEVGTLQDIESIGAICKKNQILFHTDAAQAASLIELNVETMNIDLMSLSAHKMYGPKGVGALYVKKNKNIRLHPILHGGSQEFGLRPGTLNVPGVVGFGEACKIARSEMKEDQIRIGKLRDHLWKHIHGTAEDARQNGDLKNRLANNLHVTLPGTESESFIRRLKNIAISTGAACSSHKRLPSPILIAMGYDSASIHSSLRFGLGKFTTFDEIEATAIRLQEEILKTEDENQWEKT